MQGRGRPGPHRASQTGAAKEDGRQGGFSAGEGHSDCTSERQMLPSPDQRSSVGWVSSHKVTDSQSGHAGVGTLVPRQGTFKKQPINVSLSH